MRIAHITDCFAPRTGGIETQVLGLASRQMRAGHDVRVITATPGRDELCSGRDEIAGLPVIRLATRMPFELPMHPAAYRQVLEILRRERVDVVHVHAGVASPFAWGGIRAARRIRVPIVVTVHSMWDALSRSGQHVLDRTPWGLGSGAVVTAVGSMAAQRVRAALGVPVHVLPNGIDEREWRVDRIHSDDGTLRVVSVLRLAPRKRALALVAVLQRAIVASGGRIRATLIGDGPEEARIRRYIDRHGMREVISLTGRLAHPRIRAHFAACDVFIQASVRESFGIAALEARAAGLAVVAREQAGTSDFVASGIEGVLAKDDVGLVDALVTLQQDRAFLDRIVSHNAAVPPAQAWPSVLAKAEEVYALARSANRRALG